jgi:hypothetical protein
VRCKKDFQQDSSFLSLISIFVDIDKASPVQLRQMISSVGPVLGRLAQADQLLFSSLLKDRQLKRVEELQLLEEHIDQRSTFFVWFSPSVLC